MKPNFVYHQNEFSNHNHHKSFSLIFRLLMYPALEVRNEDFDKSEPADTKRTALIIRFRKTMTQQI